MRAAVAWLIPSLLLAGCGPRTVVTSVAAGPPPVADAADPGSAIPPAWSQVVHPADRARIDGLATAWNEALGLATTPRDRALRVAEGALLDPAVALARPDPPPGRYRCRVVRLGAPAARTRRGRAPAITAYPPWFCFVEAEGSLLTFVKETGDERPEGRLWPDRPDRLIFLGAVATGGEGRAPGYGHVASRDVAGVVERIAPFRWRLVLPRPASGAILDVIELTPFTPPPAG